MTGALIIFFCMSFMIKLLLAKNTGPVLYAGINYLIFFMLYFFLILKSGDLDYLVPLLMIISLTLTIIFYPQKSKKESGVIK